MKWIIKVFTLVGGLLSVATTASALPQYVAPMNTALGTTGLSCEACHAGYPTVPASRTTITLPMGITQAARLPLGSTDSDQDGFTNAQEASGTALDFNNNLVTPFTKAVATANDVKLPNVFVQGDSQATEFAITDIYTQAGITLAAGKEVLGGATATTGVAVDVYTIPVTLLFKAGAPDAAAMVYAIDTYTQTTPTMATWTLGSNGSITITGGISTAAGPARIVVVRATPVSPTLTTPTTLQPGTILSNFGENEGDGENEGGSSGAIKGCMVNVSALPWLMFVGLLSLVFAVQRKRYSV